MRIDEEAQKDPPGVAQHHHERHQRALGAADHDLAKVAPIDLSLLAGQGPQALKGLRRLLRTIQGDLMAKMIRSARIAPFLHHHVQTAGGESGIDRQGLLNER